MRTIFLALTLSIYLSFHVITFAGETLVLARGPSSQHSQQPQVAVDAKGAIHVVFGVGDEIRYCRSDDGGTSFSKPLALRPVHAMSLGMRRGPRIAVTDSAICVTAIGGKQGKGRDGDLLALRSTNGGKSWSEPVAVNDTADAAREGLHAMSAGPRDSVCCVWLRERGNAALLLSPGASSPAELAVNASDPVIASRPDGRGPVVVVWEAHEGDEYTIRCQVVANIK